MEQANQPYVIVVGIDYSEPAELALEQAFDMAAEKRDAEVHVVHVISPFLAGYAPQSASFSYTPDILARSQERLQAHVEAARQRRNLPASVRTLTHVRLDGAASEVAQMASDLEADLVVVGTHGRRGLSRMLLGSVAEISVRFAPCPVLVVRAKAPAEPVPQIEPPCPHCLEVRQESKGETYWCAQHAQHHGQRHTYHQGDRASSDSNLPLVFQR